MTSSKRKRSQKQVLILMDNQFTINSFHQEGLYKEREAKEKFHLGILRLLFIDYFIKIDKKKRSIVQFKTALIHL
jgi:hypothetical protein